MKYIIIFNIMYFFVYLIFKLLVQFLLNIFYFISIVLN